MSTLPELINIERHKTKTDSLGVAECGTGCIVEVAADTNAMTEALAEFGFRLALEEAGTWETNFDRTWFNAKKRVILKLVDEIKSKQGQK